MRLCSIASGSSGNCVFIEAGQTRILIDAGYSGRQIQQLLDQRSIDPKSLDGIFITHEHNDHIKGAGVMARRFKLPIIANYKTWKQMKNKLGKIPAEHRLVFENYKEFSFGDLKVMAIPVYHDAVDPVGYQFSYAGKTAIIMTDTGLIDQAMQEMIMGADLYYIEANHDPDMLRTGPYPPMLQERIRSTYGHVSNQETVEVLRQVMRTGKETVLLGHLSESNNTPELCLSTVSTGLQKAGFFDLEIHVAPRYEPSPIFEIGQGLMTYEEKSIQESIFGQ